MPRPERLELLRTNPLIEITLLHRAMRLELEAMCEATRALAAAPANDGAALAALRRRFRAFDAVFASHSAAEDDVVFPALAACAGRAVASHAAAEHIDEVALVAGAAAALAAAAARGRCAGAAVAGGRLWAARAGGGALPEPHLRGARRALRDGGEMPGPPLPRAGPDRTVESSPR